MISGAVYREGVAYTPDGALYVAPAPGSGLPYVLAQSFAAVSGAADTNENTLATITIPANAMGANGAVRIYTLWTVNNNANAKTARIKFGGTTYESLTLANNTNFADLVIVGNRGVTNSQVGFPSNHTNPFGLINSAAASSAVDTTAAVTILLTAQKATGSDTMTLEGYIVELIRAS